MSSGTNLCRPETALKGPPFRPVGEYVLVKPILVPRNGVVVAAPGEQSGLAEVLAVGGRVYVCKAGDTVTIPATNNVCISDAYYRIKQDYVQVVDYAEA